MGSSHCVPTVLASAQVTSSQGGAQARPQHSQAPGATHHLQLELSSFLRTHDVMNPAEHPIKSTNLQMLLWQQRAPPLPSARGLRLCLSS